MLQVLHMGLTQKELEQLTKLYRESPLANLMYHRGI